MPSPATRRLQKGNNEVNTSLTKELPENFKSGYVMLMGRPNVGKSTILNQFLGEQLAIVTPKPQTTRNRIQGIYTRDDCQVIFLDTPGVVKSARGLNAFLALEVQRAMSNADVIVLVVEPYESARESEEKLLEKIAKLNVPIILAINKVDKVEKLKLLPLIEEYNQRYSFRAIVPISALRSHGLDGLLSEVVAILPKGPMYYPPDQISDANERFFVGELIREQVFLFTKQEIPYSSAVVVESFKDKGDIVHIDAAIFVERDGQKGIVIGKNGEMLKKIGSAARVKIEVFLHKKVFLQLLVKVKKDWTRSEGKMREMGYK